MTTRAAVALAACLLTVLFGGVAALTVGAGTAALASCTAPGAASSNSAGPSGAAGPSAGTGHRVGGSRWPAVGDWDSEQAGHAAVIVAAGRQRGVPPRGWVIAVAVAMTESRLRNLAHQGEANDHDSLGLFQQRPSQGWGTPQQLRDPGYAAGAFYDHLVTVDDWQHLPLSVAAQRVQRSAYPDAYAAFEEEAIAVVDVIGSRTVDLAGIDAPGGFTTWLGLCAGLGGDGLAAAVAEQLPDGFVLPYGTPPAVVTALNWALAQLGTPYAFGGDCTDPHSGNPARQCDCSSLVQQAYRAAGVTLPRTTTQQVTAGTAVPSPDAMRPGDLVFIPGSMGTRANPRHVGLYLGGGLVVQAPRTGDAIKISKLAAWSGQVAAIRRATA